MPYINAAVSVPLSPEKEEALKAGLGEAITLIPGKTEKWLMVGLEGGRRLYFAGDGTKPAAFVEVMILGRSDKQSYTRVTAAICDLLGRELGIPADRVYVKYDESEHWGWNGGNF